MSKSKDRFFISLIALMLVGTAAINKANAATPVQEVSNFKQVGKASWYGANLHGRKTSTGERFNMNALTAAHRSLPLPSYVRVTNLANNKSIIVRVNDRGPFHGGRVMDLSKGAAQQLGFLSQGSANIRIESLDASSDSIQIANAPLKTNQFQKVTVSLPKVNQPINLSKINVENLNNRQAATVTQRLVKVALTQSAFAPFGEREQALYLDSPLFGSLKEANAHLLKLTKQMRQANANYPIVLIENGKAKGYHVRIGPFKEAKNADEIRKRLSAS